MSTTDLVVSVKRTTLLTCLIANQEKYAKVYDEAMVAWRLRMKEWLAELQTKFEDPDCAPCNVYCPHAPPENHRDDYADTIGLLEASCDETLKITTHQHACFVNNKWLWMSGAKMSLRAYTVNSETL